MREKKNPIDMRIAAVADGFNRGWCFTPVTGKKPKLSATKPTPVYQSPAASRHQDLDRYIQKALDEEVSTVTGTEKGKRNARLNEAAFSMGTLAAHGLAREVAENALVSAAMAAGLSENEARTTFSSGWTDGEKQPREIKNREVFKGTDPGTSSETIAPAIDNFEYVYDEDGKPKKSALPLGEITKKVLTITQGWPKRVGNLLFVLQGDAIRWLETPPALFAWLAKCADILWGNGGGIDGRTLTPKTEFFEHLAASAEQFDTVEKYPHHPPIPRAFYTWKKPDKPSTGKSLAGLLAFFDNVESGHDAVLVRAMFLTPGYGGLPGTRPCFAIMAPDRGCGKSTLTDALAKLWGGAVELEPDGRAEERITQRLLSKEALRRRIVRIDNVRSSASSGLVESLITMETINGHRLHYGDATRTNYLTWTLTGNVFRLSRDMAERSFIIRLKKPNSRPGWREEVFAYIEKYRHQIISDILEILRSPAKGAAVSDRWQSWVNAVLMRCTDDPVTVVTLNQQRRDESDDALEEAASIMACLCGFQDVAWDDDGYAFIPSALMTKVIETALNRHLSAAAVAQRLKGHIEAGRLPITQMRTSNRRGYEVRKPTEGK